MLHFGRDHVLASFNKLEIKHCGLGSIIQDVIAFLYKTEIKIIYILCAMVCDCMVYPDPKFLICKTKEQPIFF